MQTEISPYSVNSGHVGMVVIVLRALLQVAAGSGLTFGVFGDNELYALAGAIVFIVTIVWSRIDKKKAQEKTEKAAVASAVASADAARPIPIINPKG